MQIVLAAMGLTLLVAYAAPFVAYGLACAGGTVRMPALAAAAARSGRVGVVTFGLVGVGLPLWPAEWTALGAIGAGMAAIVAAGLTFVFTRFPGVGFAGLSSALVFSGATASIYLFVPLADGTLAGWDVVAAFFCLVFPIAFASYVWAAGSLGAVRSLRDRARDATA